MPPSPHPLLQKWVNLASKIPILNLAHKLATRSVESRAYQETMDTQRVYFAAKYHEHNLKKYLEQGQNANVSYDEVPEQSLSRFYSRRKDFVSEYQTRQVQELFNNILEKGHYNPYPNPIIDERSDTDKYLEDNLDIKYDVGTSGAKILHPHGFSMQITRSTIDHPSAGYGVIAEGNIIPGTLLAFYPGMVHIPADLTQEFFDRNNTEYMIGRYDGYVIDGRHWDQQAFRRFRKHHQYAQFGINIADEFLHKYQNPFAIGNYINHPPKGKSPNVMAYSFDFLPEFSEEMQPFIPNKNKRKISFIYNTGVLMRTILIIATKHISNEELFLNYRFNPRNTTPEWYHQPDEAQASRRWGRIGAIL